MLLRPDKQPQTGTLVGAPKLSDFPPLGAEEIETNIAAPMRAALGHGVDPSGNTYIPVHVVCRLVSTIRALAKDSSALLALVGDLHQQGLMDTERTQKLIESLELKDTLAQIFAHQEKAQDQINDFIGSLGDSD
jgi:hypothetical protein